MRYAAQCGMSEAEFWNCTPRYMDAKIKALELQQRLTWEQARYVSLHAIQAADYKNKYKVPTDLGRFPWEIVHFPKASREDWDKFSDEADEVLRVTNPGLYEQYMAAKMERNGKGAIES